MLRREPVVVDEPHNMPLQFLSETGSSASCSSSRAAAAALWAALACARAIRPVTRSALAVAAFFVHRVVDIDWNYVATCGPLLFVAGALVASRLAPAGCAARGVPLLPLAARRSSRSAASTRSPRRGSRSAQLAPRVDSRQAQRAHSYDPLSVDALTDWAASRSRRGPAARAQLYREAVSLEPQNATTWFELGDFYRHHEPWTSRTTRYSNSCTYDRFGPAAQPCGLLDQARYKALNYAPPALAAQDDDQPASP